MFGLSIMFRRRGKQATGTSLAGRGRGRGGRDCESGENLMLVELLSGLLKHYARRWLTRGAMPPWKVESERANVGACGGVCMVGCGSEHGCNRRRCPTRKKVERKGQRAGQQGNNTRVRHVLRVSTLILLVSYDFRCRVIQY